MLNINNNTIDNTSKEFLLQLEKQKRQKILEEDVFFISDTHFFHKNIITYCNRPWNSGKDTNGELIITEDNINQMTEDLINNWNNVVGKNDKIYFLGDFALGNRKLIPSVVERLNGRKRIVLGNHDYFSVKKYDCKNIVDFFYKAGFERVYDTPIIINSFIILSHEPLSWIKDGGVYMNIYGHVHNQELYRDYTHNTFCVSAERINYTPIKFSKIFELCSNFKNS